VQLNKLSKKKNKCLFVPATFHFMFCVNLCKIWFIQKSTLQNTKVYNTPATGFVLFIYLFIYFKYE